MRSDRAAGWGYQNWIRDPSGGIRSDELRLRGNGRPGDRGRLSAAFLVFGGERLAASAGLFQGPSVVAGRRSRIEMTWLNRMNIATAWENASTKPATSEFFDGGRITELYAPASVKDDAIRSYDSAKPMMAFRARKSCISSAIARSFLARFKYSIWTAYLSTVR